MINKTISFKTNNYYSLVGDLYLPLTGERRPAVVVVHGGGWSSRTGDMQNVCLQLVSEGFVAFNITYRLAPRFQFPLAVLDVKEAISWLYKNADAYNINPDQIAGWGYSAGANLILLAALDGKQNLKAIVAGGTPADLTVWPKSSLVQRWLGSKFEHKPELWKKASPVFQVTHDSPPLFLYHGTWDKIVEVQQMEKMKQAMIAKNRIVETFEVAMMGHLTLYFFSLESVRRGINFIKNVL